MAEISVFWLRVAAAFYSLDCCTPSLRSSAAASNSSVSLSAPVVWAPSFTSSPSSRTVSSTGQCPITNFYETLSMCAFLIVLLYLFVQWRYKLESMSVFIFPLVFVMSLVATFGNPVGSWPNPVVGGAWLTRTSRSRS